MSSVQSKQGKLIILISFSEFHKMLLKYKLILTQYLKRLNNKPNILFEIFQLNYVHFNIPEQ